jgi:hypothetical protein
MSARLFLLAALIGIGAVVARSESSSGLFSDFAIQVDGGKILSSFDAQGSAAAAIDPMGNAKASLRPAYGLGLEWKARSYATLSTSVQWETWAHTLPKSVVLLQDNPFPHDMEGSVRYEILRMPLVLSLGHFGSRHSFGLRTGVYWAEIQRGQVLWKFDGRENRDRSPTPDVVGKPWTGWQIGLEYGLRIGRHRVVLFGENTQSLESLKYDDQAEIDFNATRLGWGYRFHFSPLDDWEKFSGKTKTQPRTNTGIETDE